MKKASFNRSRIESLCRGAVFFSAVIFALLASSFALSDDLPIPPPPKVAAKGYILLDAESEKILAGNNMDERVAPASLTKMMTAYLVEKELSRGSIKASQKVVISEKAWRMKGSLMFVEVGEAVTVEELLKGVIIVSGNDASVALAEFIAGSEEGFVQLMNNMAKKLGMHNTHFANASGWPDERMYTTARDMAILSSHLIKDFPEQYQIYSHREFQYGVNKSTGKLLNPQPNRNTLLFTNPSVDGIKTGHSEEAGYNLAASSKKDGRRLIAVVMGTNSEVARARETQKLLTYGFRFYENVDLYQSYTALEQVKIWKGIADQLPVGLKEDLIITVPRGTSSKLSTVIDVSSDLVAPVIKGQVVGSLEVKMGERRIKEVPLLALESVKAGGFFTRLWDSLIRFFMSLFGE